MYKYLPLVVIVLCLFITQSHSQSIQLLISSDTIYTTSDKSEGYATVQVKNISSNLIHVRVDRVNEVLSGAQETYFCWEQCYPPTTSSSSGAIKINALDSNFSFTAHVMPNGEAGISTATFLFSNEDEIDDTVSINLVFDVTAPSGIKKWLSPKNIVKIDANSINNSIDVQLFSLLPQLTIAVYSISGQLIYNKSFNNATGLINIPVSKILNGMYLVQLTSSDFYYSQKVVVNH